MEHNRLRLTLIGGPTLLLEWRGLRLLTDPTFDDSGTVYERGPVVLRKTTGPATDARSLEPIHAALGSTYQATRSGSTASPKSPGASLTSA